jgi:hypothetical protein
LSEDWRNYDDPVRRCVIREIAGFVKRTGRFPAVWLVAEEELAYLGGSGVEVAGVPLSRENDR